MNPARVDVGLDVAARALYLVFVCAMLYVMFPAGRAWAKRWLASAIFAYRVGRYGERFARMPLWQQELLTVRGRTPRELAK